MHDTGSHMSSGDTSYTSYTSHTGHGFAAGQADQTSHTGHGYPAGQADQPFFTPNPADPASYGGISARRRRGPSMIVVLIVLAAIMPIVFTLLALGSH